MAKNKRILIAATDPELTSQIADALEKDHYNVLAVHNMSDSVDPVQSFDPDLVILDPALTGSDPHGYLHTFWEKTHIPVLVVSNASDIPSRVLWLEKGADDYMVKPFDLRELIARVQALLRRCRLRGSFPEPETPVTVEHPDLIIDLNNYTVLYRGEKLSMPPKELELLYFLASSPGQVFTRNQLLRHIWGYDYAGDTRTVDVHIKRLRRKLSPPHDWSIETVWGVGYKFQPGV